MNKSRFMLMVCFLAAFVAGLVLGLAGPKQLASLVRFKTTGSGSVPSEHPDHPRRSGPPSLDRILNLTPEQKLKIDQIWSEADLKADQEWRQREEQRRAMDEQRKQAILALIPADKHEAYDRIRQEYAEKVDAFMRERPVSFEQAIEQTKQVLNSDQKQKYDEWMRQSRSSGPRGRGPGRRGEERATTHPGYGRSSRQAP